MRITYPQGTWNGPQRELPFVIGILASLAPSDVNLKDRRWLEIGRNHPIPAELSPTLKLCIEQAPTSARVQIKILNVTRREVVRDLGRAVDFTQSGLFKQLHDNIFGVASPCPLGLILCDWDYDASPTSVDLLELLSYILEAIHAPLIIARSPEFDDHGTISKLAIQTNPQFAKWGSFQGKESAHFVIDAYSQQDAALVAARIAEAFDQQGWFKPTQQLFAISRTAHYVRALVNDWSAPFASIEECEHTLNAWVAQYVTEIPQASIRIVASGVSPDLLLAQVFINMSQPARVIATLPPGKITQS